MGLRRTTVSAANRLLQGGRYQLVESAELYDWQKHAVRGPRYREDTLPPGAAEYLSATNARLPALQRRYAAFDTRVTEPLVWTDYKLRPEDIPWFRGDNAYVWQLRGRNMNEMGYALATYFLLSEDTTGLFGRLQEDGLFGNFTFEIAGQTVSRDLLDSIAEIWFLDRHLGLSTRQDFSVLDIGAGYGRLAHRMTAALPNLLHYYCADAIAVSSFICDYYLGFRGIRERASSVPLDEIEQTLASRRIDLAVNIHSFSECTERAIRWWLDRLAHYRVPYLMVVPNHFDRATGRLLTNDGGDMNALILDAGYRQWVIEPKYGDPVVQKYAINPAWYGLFKLAGK